MAIVYILTNESMPDIIKVGITENLDRRVRELDNTSTIAVFKNDEAEVMVKFLNQHDC